MKLFNWLNEICPSPQIELGHTITSTLRIVCIQLPTDHLHSIFSLPFCEDDNIKFTECKSNPKMEQRFGKSILTFYSEEELKEAF